MIERVVENWLAKANERTFQLPFCHALSLEGHTVLHLSRHCGMEMGKDVITIAPDGIPCAYQLKGAHGGKIGLKKWRDEISKQIVDLALGKVVHPSVSSTKAHRSYLVVNGELEEEVIRAIDDFNRAHPRHRIRTILMGELFRMFKKLQTNFWPPDIPQTKTLIEMFLMTGRETLPKDKLAPLLESALSLHGKQKPTVQEAGRAIANAAILNALATSSFSNADNHAAEFEAWTICAACILAAAERWNLPPKVWKGEFDIALMSMLNALGRLCEELRERKHLVEGDPLTDHLVQRPRITYLVSLMSLLALWRDAQGLSEASDTFIREFCLRNSGKMVLWGEYAAPQFLAWHFYQSRIDGSIRSDGMLLQLVSAITTLNKPRGKSFLANPYYSVDEILPHLTGLSDEPLDDTFAGHSHTLEALLHLAARTNLKQQLKLLWPSITKIAFSSFVPAHRWQFYLWRSSQGTDWERQVIRRQNWDTLKKAAFESRGNDLPRLIKEFPIFLLCFLCVYPHRLNAGGIRWLATRLDNLSGGV